MAARARRQSSSSSFGENGETCPGGRLAVRGVRGEIDPVVISASLATVLTGVLSKGAMMLQAEVKMPAVSATASFSGVPVAQTKP
jgi:hypothetical protein